MKVLFQLLDAGVGGGQQVALAVAAALTERGDALGLIVPSGGPAAEAFSQLGAQVVEDDLTTLRRPGAVIGAARILRGYDILYTHTSVPGATLAGAAARLARRPLVVHQHSALHFSDRSTVALAQRILFVRSLGHARAVAVADHIAAQLVAAGLDVKKIDVVPNGVAPAKPRPAAPDRPPTVGILARLDPGKGLDTFVGAAQLLAGSGIRFVAGVAPGPFTGFERRIRAEAEAANVTLVENADGAGFLAEIDVLAFPSRHEGSPLVLLEALALGLPVVASDISGVREIVGPEDAAALVPAGDVRALAAAVSLLAGDPQLRAELGARGRTVVESRYRLDSMLDRTIAILRAEAARG